MDRFRSDLLSALRALRSTPATAASAVITLAVAVGLNFAMYGLVDRALGRCARGQLGTMLLSLFGALALSLAAIGLYAAFAHSVGERRHEMAIRIAVGAEPRGVLVMILREAARLAGAGVLCGCAVTILAGRWLQSMLFGTAPTDPLVLGSAAVLMLAVALAATLLPARSASRSDPNSLLRAE